jgi:type I restriction enzyme S subunit
LEEQKRIVELLDAATAHVTELTACYEQARTHASDLFSSASRGAFKGNPDWTNKTIGDVCDLVNGATPDTKVMDYWGGKHAWITPAEMGGLDSPFLSISRRTLSDKGLASCSATLVPPNTVILSSRAPIGHLVINEVPMATNQGCKSLIPKDGLDFSFLYYYLKANVEYLESLGTGTTFKELSGTQLKTVGIPVPSLEEQRKIVARLDSMRAKTSEMVAAYDAKLTAAKNLRQSILEAAFAGEL